MKTLTLDELQRDLPAAIALVRAGEAITLTEGDASKPVALLSAPSPGPAAIGGPASFSAGETKVTFRADFKMTDEELLGWEEVVAVTPDGPFRRRRVLGRLAGRGEFRSGPDFEMSDEELLGDVPAS